MQTRLWQWKIRAAGLVLQFGVASAFAQSSPPTTPSTPPLPAGVAPPTGGPNSLPTGEPANAIAGGDGLKQGVSPFTEAQARSRLQQNGYRQVSALAKDQDGVWRGSATKAGHPVHVGLDYKGNITTN